MIGIVLSKAKYSLYVLKKGEHFELIINTIRHRCHEVTANKHH